MEMMSFTIEGLRSKDRGWNLIIILSVFVKLQLSKFYLLPYDKFYNQNGLNSCVYHSFVISIWSSKQRKT